MTSSGGSLTVLDSVGGGSLTLSSAATYTGPTALSAATLYLTGSGSLSASSSVTITNGGVLDASQAAGGAFTMGAGQNLYASNAPAAYAVNGLLVTGSGTAIYPGGDGPPATLTFNQGLTLAPGATLNLDVGSAYNGPNDQIVVNGLLAANGNSIHIKASNTSASLDTHDYLLITATSISGSFAATPVFDVQPVNFQRYTVVTTPTGVYLHYMPYPVAFSSLTPSQSVSYGIPTVTLQGTLGGFVAGVALCIRRKVNRSQ